MHSYEKSSGKLNFAGLEALQGESLQDEPRLRGTMLLLFNYLTA
jgi:hypothetical protein